MEVGLEPLYLRYSWLAPNPASATTRPVASPREGTAHGKCRRSRSNTIGGVKSTRHFCSFVERAGQCSYVRVPAFGPSVQASGRRDQLLGAQLPSLPSVY